MDDNDARARGNAAYSKRKFHEAIELYTEAHTVASTDYRPVSNRAAAWFELADYRKAAEDSRLALTLPMEDKNRLKILLRAAKSHLYLGEYLESSAAYFEAAEVGLEQSELLQRMGAAAADMLTEGGVASMSLRLTRVPICRPSPVSVLEFYPIGNESAFSLLDGPMGSLDPSVRGYGRSWPMAREQQEAARLVAQAELTCFLGGAGDCRHALRTILHYTTLDAEQEQDMKRTLDVTLNDINILSVARAYVIFELLHELGKQLAAPSVTGSEGIAELELLLYYIYFGPYLMPHQAEKLQQLLLLLSEQPTPTGAWIDCPPHVWTAMRATFKAWSETKVSSREMDAMARVAFDAPDHEPLYRRKEAGKADWLARIDAMPDSEVANTPMPPLTSVSEKRKAMRTLYDDPEFDPFDNVPDDDGEVSTKPGEDEAWLTTRLLPLPPERRAAHAKLFSGHPTEQRAAWCGNVTMVDVDSLEFRRQQPSGFASPGDGPRGQQMIVANPFTIIHALTANGHTIGPPGKPCRRDGRSLFHSAMGILRPCASAIHGLALAERLCVRFEAGDLHSPLEARAATFDRVYVSNVPDYTSLLNTFLYAVPALKPVLHCTVQHQVLLNTPIWADLDEYVHSATLLTPENRRSFGVGASLVSGDVMDRTGCPRWRADPHSPKRYLDAGRSAVESWLQRLLLAIIWPAERKVGRASPAEECPLNMSSFFKALERLQSLGCPLHWLADMVHALLEGSLRVSATSPPTSPNPCTSASRKQPEGPSGALLAPALMEARVMAALWQPRLGRCITGSQVAASIVHWQKVMLAGEMPVHFTAARIGHLSAGLLLVDHSVQALKQMPREACPVRSLAQKAPPDSCHLISVLTWDSNTHTVGAWLPQETLDAMRSPGSLWHAIVFRSDSWVPLTGPTPMVG